ncbi:MAG TPA: cohesin domain-containing protein [Dehalococcoidia bacterium]|nr:cohesin domain-containing protein [Dehalococcoidia bacterium]
MTILGAVSGLRWPVAGNAQQPTPTVQPSAEPSQAPTPAATAQQSPATVRAEGPSGSVSKSAKQVVVAIKASNVHDLAGFQFVLAFDASVLKPLAVNKTQFLAQSGREILCADATLEQAAVRLSCVTLRETPAGVDGGGTLANVIFQPVSSGTTALALKNVILVHRDGSPLPITVQDGKLSVSGSSWWTTTRIILVAGGGAIVVLVVAAGVWWARRTGRAPDAQPPVGSA